MVTLGVKKSSGVRKNVKEWRKNIDDSSVTESLIDKANEERLGGSATSKPDGSLFIIDKAGSTKTRKKITKRLRIDEILQPQSAVTLEPTKKPKVKKIHSIPKLSVALPGVKNSTPESGKNKQYDLWENDSKANGKKKKSVVPPVARNLTQHRAVVVEHPGNSYNPLPEQHQEVMAMAVKPEIKKIEEQEAVKQMLKFPKELANESNMVEKANQALLQSIDDSDAESPVNDAPSEHPLSNKATVRKTKAQRKKEARVKATERRQARLKRKKILQKEFDQLRKISKELQKKAQIDPEQDAIRKRKKLIKSCRLKRLGPIKFSPIDIPIKTTDELVSNLRLLKPEGNIFEDRFASFQARNILETRKRQRVKKANVKLYEKHHYKNFK